MFGQSSRFLIGSLFASFISWSAHAELPNVLPTQGFGGDHDEDFRNTGYLGDDVDMYGNVAIAGQPGAQDHAGEAFIYVRDSAGHWNQTATLTPSDSNPGQWFGARVALLDNRAVVASYGAIYLFVRQSSGAWLQKDKHTFARAAGVSDLDWQGNLLVVGVLGDPYPNYAFAYDSSQTNLLRKIARFAPTDAAKSDGFGTRVAAYGSTVIATAPGYNSDQGAAYVYTCGTSACTQSQKIVSIAGKPGDKFGSSADINGTYLVIGAPGADQSGEYDAAQGGSAYVYTRAGKAWAQTQTLHPTSQDYSNYVSFGEDLTIQGSRLLISSPRNNVFWEGLVFEYTVAGGVWSPRALLRSDLDGFGESTSLIGEFAIVGTPNPGNKQEPSRIDFYKLP
jgi:hypothetical protein